MSRDSPLASPPSRSLRSDVSLSGCRRCQSTKRCSLALAAFRADCVYSCHSSNISCASSSSSRSTYTLGSEGSWYLMEGLCMQMASQLRSAIAAVAKLI